MPAPLCPHTRRRSFGILASLAVSASFLIASGSPASAEGCAGSAENDFNGDGVTDVAIADPQATVSGKLEAGAVHVDFGPGVDSQTLSLASGLTSKTPEARGRFGWALDSYDANQDGCADLVVGVPDADVAGATDAGIVYVFPGSHTGLNTAATEYWQGKSGQPGLSESGDRFGFSVAAGKTSTGQPFLIAGTPGEDNEGQSLNDVGAILYIQGSTMTAVSQTDLGVSQGSNDQFGYSVDATPKHFAVGAPCRKVGTAECAGSVGIFDHQLVSGKPKSLGSFTQDSAAVPGGAEAQDYFGKAVSLAPYIVPGGDVSKPGSMLAVGIPGEDLSGNAIADCGSVNVFEVDINGVVTSLDQNSPGVSDLSETGDSFGETVLLANRTPAAAATVDNMLLAVGIPGEDSASGLVDSGGVQKFSMVGPYGDNDLWADQGGLPAAGWSYVVNGRFGLALSASVDYLFLGDAYGSSQAVYGIPWQNITTPRAQDPVKIYKAPTTPGVTWVSYGRVVH